MILQALRDGWRTARSFWALALVLYIGNLVVAAGVACAVAWLLEAAAGSSLAPHVLVEGYNATVFSDLRHEGFDYGRTAFGALLVAAPLSLLVNAFLAGGVIGTLMPQDSRVSLWRLAASCVAYLGRFLRLLVLGLLLLLALGGAAALAITVLVPATGWEPATEKDLAEIIGIGILVTLGGGMLLWMAMDYARLWIVRDRMRSSRQALGRGFRLITAHPLATLALQLTPVVLLAATVIIQLLFGIPFRMDSVGGILAVAVPHQVAVFARSWVRLSMIASQIALVNALPPEGGRAQGAPDREAPTGAGPVTV